MVKHGNEIHGQIKQTFLANILNNVHKTFSSHSDYLYVHYRIILQKLQVNWNGSTPIKVRKRETR